MRQKCLIVQKNAFRLDYTGNRCRDRQSGGLMLPGGGDMSLGAAGSRERRRIATVDHDIAAPKSLHSPRR